ncbi:MAG: VacJ family lipoprotein [Pseudomonadota bacterium]
MRRSLVLAAVAVLGACTTKPQRLEPAPATIEANDPLKSVNEFNYKANRVFDDLYIKPFATAYRTVIPRPVRKSTGHFTDNLLMPMRIANEVLQVDAPDTVDGTARFVVNSTLGVGGLFDPATGMGLERQDEDFEQTLGNWGVPRGPYIVAPVLGPTTPRGLVGSSAGLVLAPLSTLGVFTDPSTRVLLSSQRAVDDRNEANATLERIYMSDDGYIVLRSLYLQNRDQLLHEDAEDPYENLPDF